MAGHLELEDARNRVSITPELGGGIAGFWAKRAGTEVPVLRPMSGPDAFSLSANVLVPFSNRIADGVFAFEGVTYHVPRNLDGERHPIHGDGFQRWWEVERHSAQAIALVLSRGGIGPWDYSARLGYRLEDGRLAVSLDVTNSGPRLPFGAGFHPWLPRLGSTRMRFNAASLWLEDSEHLPTSTVPALGQWDYSAGRALPDGLINNAFCGWDGIARIDQSELDLSVTIASDCDYAIVYSPGKSAPFFCFEPVTHPVNAMNLPGAPGLKVLDTGQVLHAEMIIGWDATAE